MISVGCATRIVATAPEHCVTKDEVLDYVRIANAKWQIFQPTEDGRATRYQGLADRVDYLEAYCVSVNAYRGETLGNR